MSDLWSQAPQRQIRPFLSMLPGCAKEPQKMPSGSEVTTWRWRHLTPDTENQNTQREKYITSTPCSTPHHLQMMCCKAEEQISFAHCSKRSQSSCKSHWLWAPKRRHVQWSRYFMVSHRDCLSDAFSNPRTCSVLNRFATLAGILVQDLLAPSWTAHTIAPARLLQSVTSVSLTVSCCFILFYSLRRERGCREPTESHLHGLCRAKVGTCTNRYMLPASQPSGTRQLGHNIINDGLCRFGSTMSVMQRCHQHDLTKARNFGSIFLHSGSEAFESPEQSVNNELSVQKPKGSCCALSSIERCTDAITIRTS